MSIAPKRSLLLAAFFAATGMIVLVSLGVWQIERLAWKNDLVARIDARSHAAPRPLAASGDWPKLVADDHEYEHVVATGVFEHSNEALIYRGSGKIEAGQSQPGYWVMTPLRLSDGARVLVNRGFVPLDRRDAATRAVGQTAGEVTVTGLWRAPEARGMFTPPDNPAKGEWFTRDPAAIAAAIKLERFAPFSIDEDAHAAPTGSPAGGATVIDIPNNHLSYALTWFGLAATLAGVFAAFALRKRDA